MVYEHVVKSQEKVVPGLRAGRCGVVSRGLARLASLRAWRLLHLYRAQTDLIFPGQITQGDARYVVRPRNGTELVQLTTTHGDTVAALFGAAQYEDGSPRADASGRPTILFFYGNTMELHGTEVIVSHLRRLGLNVLSPEYVGYGMSTGRASETNCYATADAAYDYLLRRPDVDPSLIMVGGASLGGAVAIDLASRRPEIKAALTIVTFTSIPRMARHLQPRVPIWRFIRHKFDSLSKMPAVKCPVMIAHSRHDTLVPVSMADELANAAGGEVERVDIEGADHGTMQLIEAGASVLFVALKSFVETHLPVSERRLTEAA